MSRLKPEHRSWNIVHRSHVKTELRITNAECEGEGGRGVSPPACTYPGDVLVGWILTVVAVIVGPACLALIGAA